MGHPRKQRPKYRGPSHPWQRARMAVETVLRDKYGLKTKKEIWRITSLLKTFKDQTKRLIAGSHDATTAAQVQLETTQLRNRLARLGIIDSDAPLDAILDLTPEHIMNRRLQTLVYTKGLAHTITQARQFVVHQHILVGDKCINVPSYLVRKDEEHAIRFIDTSSLNDPDHPERSVKAKEASTVVAKPVDEPTKQINAEQKGEQTGALSGAEHDSKEIIAENK